MKENPPPVVGVCEDIPVDPNSCCGCTVLWPNGFVPEGAVVPKGVCGAGANGCGAVLEDAVGAANGCCVIELLDPEPKSPCWVPVLPGVEMNGWNEVLGMLAPKILLPCGLLSIEDGAAPPKDDPNPGMLFVSAIVPFVIGFLPSV